MFVCFHFRFEFESVCWPVNMRPEEKYKETEATVVTRPGASLPGRACGAPYRCAFHYCARSLGALGRKSCHSHRPAGLASGH